jgi:hypothetical protein
MVKMTPTHAKAIAAAPRALSHFGICELIAATKIGAVEQKKTDRLFESSTEPGTR